MADNLLSRLRCLVGAHAWPEWSAWQHAGRSAYWRQRFCFRCGREQVERDG